MALVCHLVSFAPLPGICTKAWWPLRLCSCTTCGLGSAGPCVWRGTCWGATAATNATTMGPILDTLLAFALIPLAPRAFVANKHEVTDKQEMICSRLGVS